MVDHKREPKAPLSPRQAQAPLSGQGERVAKALARAGVASRREVERLILEGRIALNGQVLHTPAVKVGPEDILTVNGEQVGAAERTRVWRYHKPVGLLTTNTDPKGRPTVFDHLPAGLPRVISIGRLDINSEGLLLLTNDGALARALELPANGWVRRYRARAFGRVDQAELDRLQAGATIEGVVYGPMEARLDKVQHKGPDRSAPANNWITIALAEGKNREVRRVLESLGLKVNRLLRLAYGPFALGTLPAGAVEEVGPRVIREQLADNIAPASLPSGNRTPAAPQLGTTPPRVGKSEASSEPSPDEMSAREVKTYKPGWAKPKHKVRPHPAPRARVKRAPSARPKGAEHKSNPSRSDSGRGESAAPSTHKPRGGRPHR